MAKPLVVAIEMGYGHLRAADPLARVLGVEVLHCDRPPLAGNEEQRLWREARRLYELGSRLSQLPYVGAPLKRALDTLTHIPSLHPYRDLSAPNRSAKVVDGFARRGLGAGLVARMERTGEPLLTTFFTPAVIADRLGAKQVHCVVTDSDVNRVWAPLEGARSAVRYFAPSARVVRRLRSYGVRAEHVALTGFPLPHELLGGPSLPVLKRNLAARLVRLDPERAFRSLFGDELIQFLGPLDESMAGRPPKLAYAVGGAGAQVGLVRDFLPGFAELVRAGRIEIALIAGVRPEVASALEEAVKEAGLERERGVTILHEPEMPAYFARMNALLADTDILWTKPSEMTFFGALGLPLVLASPMGVHERYNRRWAREAGAGLKQRDARYASEWIMDWLADGTLAGAAWNGYLRLPKHGLYRILTELGVAFDESDES